MQNLNGKTKRGLMLLSFFLIFIIFLSYNIPSVNAINAEIDWPDIPGLETQIETGGKLNINLPVLVKYIFNFFIVLGGLTAFIMIVAGGVQYLTSAGNPSKTTEAKERIYSALLGLLLLLGSYLLLKVVNPDLLILPSLPGL